MYDKYIEKCVDRTLEVIKGMQLLDLNFHINEVANGFVVTIIPAQDRMCAIGSNSRFVCKSKAELLKLLETLLDDEKKRLTAKRT